MTKKEEKQRNPEWFKKSAQTLYKTDSPSVNALYEYYRKDRYIARVIYMNDNNQHRYENYRLVLFTEENGDFSIVQFRRKYGISISNKIYNREKRLMTITYKGGKFWYINNSGKQKMVRPLTLNQLGRTINQNYFTIIINKLQERFTWIRFLNEEKILMDTAFNTIIKQKIYSYKKAIKHEYKTPYPIGNILHKKFMKGNLDSFFIKNFKYNLPYLINIESLKEEWFSNLGLFRDSIKMAKTLDKKVNCSWSLRRLKEEHDKWAKIITDIMFIDGDRPMRIDEVFTKFMEYSKYEMLKTTSEMAFEGKKQNHCVATYVSNVENGRCGIYRVDDYTLEVKKDWNKKTLYLAQLRGYSNSSAPEQLVEEVKEKIKKFNEEVLDVNSTTINTNDSWDWDNDMALPF
jgi:hypothetical protein